MIRRRSMSGFTAVLLGTAMIVSTLAGAANAEELHYRVQLICAPHQTNDGFDLAALATPDVANQPGNPSIVIFRVVKGIGTRVASNNGNPLVTHSNQPGTFVAYVVTGNPDQYPPNPETSSPRSKRCTVTA